MKTIFLDLETTGTDYQTNGIHQISGFVISVIDETKLHDALYDIQLTRGIYQLITK